MLRMRSKMATKRKSAGCREPEKKIRATSLLEFVFVRQNNNPAPMPIRYSSSLESKLVEEFCRGIVNDVVDQSLDLVTRSGSCRRPVGRPRKQPLFSSLPLAGPPSQLGGCATVASRSDDGSAGSPDENGASRKNYRTWIKDQKQIAIDTAEKFGKGGRSAAVRYLQLNFPSVFHHLTEVHIRYWTRTQTNDEEKERRETPAVITGQLLAKVISAIKSQCQTGIAVNSTLLRPLILAIVEKEDRSLLQENGGPFSCSVSWINNLCRSLNLSMRRGTTAAQKLPDDWERQGEALAMRLAYLVMRYNIPPALVINLDQSSIQLLPMYGETRRETGSKDVPILGLDDKRQITVVFQAAANGKFLLPQMVFQGKTSRCLPALTIRSPLEEKGWHFTHSHNHWSNQLTMKDLISQIISPYIKSVILDQGLWQSQKAVVILDCWKVHRSTEFLGYLKQDHPNLIPLFIPAGCTSKLQVIDLVVNGHLRSIMKQCACRFLSAQASTQMNSEVEAENVKFDLKLSTLKPKLVEWLKIAVGSIEIKLGWSKAMLLQAWDRDFQSKALQYHEDSNLFANVGEDIEDDPDIRDIGSE